MSYYDPWTHVLKLFFTRLIQFLIVSLLIGTLAWHTLLKWFLDYDFMGATRMAYSGVLNMRAMLALCLIIGALLTGWLFTWLTMRWPSRNGAGDRHNRGARVIDRDEA